jgi:hypothetical protein
MLQPSHMKKSPIEHFDKSKHISNEEVMSSIIELKNFIFDASNLKKKSRKAADSGYSSTSSYHKHRRDKYRKRSRKRKASPSDDEMSDQSPSFSFNKKETWRDGHHQDEVNIQ